jgi:hypothetical protein
MDGETANPRLIFANPIETGSFSAPFDVPPTWVSEGSRCVFQTPRREQIILSASRVSGDGPATERSQEADICVFRCATILAETTTSDVASGQAVIQHPQGVCSSDNTKRRFEMARSRPFVIH